MQVGDRVIFDLGDKSCDAVIISINKEGTYTIGWPETLEVLPEEIVVLDDSLNLTD